MFFLFREGIFNTLDKMLLKKAHTKTSNACKCSFFFLESLQNPRKYIYFFSLKVLRMKLYAAS